MTLLVPFCLPFFQAAFSLLVSSDPHVVPPAPPSFMFFSMRLFNIRFVLANHNYTSSSWPAYIYRLPTLCYCSDHSVSVFSLSSPSYLSFNKASAILTDHAVTSRHFCQPEPTLVNAPVPLR